MTHLLEKFAKWTGALDLNQSTLSGAIDIVVVKHNDGTFVSTPFHVRFGKLQLLRAREKIVVVEVNDTIVPDVQMKLGEAGEAFFVKPVDELVDGVDCSASDEEFVTSPLYRSPVISPILSPTQSDGDLPESFSLPPAPLATLSVPTVESMLDNAIVPEEDFTWWTWKWGSLPKRHGSATEIAPVEHTQPEESQKNPVADAKITTKINRSTWMNSLLSMFRKDGKKNQVDGIEHQIVAVLRPRDISDDLGAIPWLVEVGILVTELGTVEVIIDSAGASPGQESLDEFFYSINDTDSENLAVETERLELPCRIRTSISSSSINDNVELLNPTSDLEMSLCGAMLTSEVIDNQAVFNQHLVSFEDFAANPTLLFNRDLIIRHGIVYYPAQVAIPLLMSYLVFRQPIPDDALLNLASSGDFKHLNDYFTNRDRIGTSGPETPSGSSRFLGWFRSPSPRRSRSAKPSPDQKPSVPTVPKSLFDDDEEAEARWSSLGFRKSLRPTSDMLASMNLQEGKNVISFSVHSTLQGVQTVEAYIYLWNEDDKLVISDVDGTITRSDLLGNIMPLMGKDWSHKGVTQLFANIISNGYKIVYVTSRAIGQAYVTREYLNSVKQGTTMLPQGPIIMSPDSLMHSFKREVIDRRPQDFKIPALRDVELLFPESVQPFFAGFGNRETDAASYEAVGVPVAKVFTINPKGEIAHYNRTLRKSYPMLNDLVDDMFPPVRSVLDSQFGGVGYWKSPYMLLDENDEF